MNIGFIADDSKKKLMQNFCIAYRGILNKHSLYATGTTGRLIEEATTLTVNKFLEGSLGGAQQFASQIENNSMDLVFYFRDPNEVSPTNTRRVQTVNETCYYCCQNCVIRSALHLCDIYSIPLATNLATAELLIRSLDSGDLEWREAYRS